MAQMRGRGAGHDARGRVLLVIVAVVALVAFASIMLLRPSSGVTVERQAETERPQTASAAVTTNRSVVVVVVVHVDGAVANPGVYELRSETPRVGDAVDAAGGLAEGADTTSMNLAAPLGDGQKVHVPLQGEEASAEVGDAAGSATAGSSDAGSSLVNINSATTEELDSLPGVGPSTAAAIVEDRDANGPFSSPEDLMRVSGIGEKKFAKLRDHVCV